MCARRAAAGAGGYPQKRVADASIGGKQAEARRGHEDIVSEIQRHLHHTLHRCISLWPGSYIAPSFTDKCLSLPKGKLVNEGRVSIYFSEMIGEYIKLFYQKRIKRRGSFRFIVTDHIINLYGDSNSAP